MIRVLHIVNSMDRGGVETTLMNIFRNIDRKEIIFDFLLQTDRECDYNEEIRALGGRIYSVTPRKKSFAKNRKELKDFFKQHKEYKIVHMHVSSLTYILPLKIAKQFKVPIRIVHSRNTRQGGSKIHKYIHKMNRLFIKNIATDYFSCSDLAGKWLYTKKILKSYKYKIINNGVDSNKFAFNEEKREEMRKILNCQNKLCLVNVGRLHPQKNHMFLLEIFKEINMQNKNTALYLVGEGALRKTIEDKIKEMDLKNNVILLGKRENINEILQAMDIFLMPSLYEGLPGSVIEAQASGLPCIISDTITKTVAITDLVRYVPLDYTSKEWAEEVLRKYKNSKRINTKEKIIQSHFDMKEISKNLQKYYIKSIGEKI